MLTKNDNHSYEQANKSVTYNLIVAPEKSVVIISAHGIQPLFY
jgi:hypothetical protein